MSKKKRELWGVLLVKETLEFSHGISLPLSWWDGMIGAVPIFDSYEAALNYAEDEKLVFKVMGESE